jgi:hypothetical protein
MAPITEYGYHHGDGVTDPIGGVHGDLYFIMITMHSGGLTEGIILYALHTEYSMPIAYTGRIERLL